MIDQVEIDKDKILYTDTLHNANDVTVHDAEAAGDDRNDIEKLILSATKSLSSVLLPMIASLGELDVDDEVLKSNDADKKLLINSNHIKETSGPGYA